MMQPGNGMVPPMAPMQPPPQQQQNYQQPPPQQQWMMPPPPQQQQQSYQQPLPPHMWAQQQQQAQQMMQAAQQQQYGGAPASSDEIRSLWIGDLQYWMDETYITNCFYNTGEVVSVKIIRNKQTGQPEGYGFIEFRSRAGAENALQTYNGTLMPSTEQNFRLNWATLGAGEKRNDDTPDYTIFVGDLAADVSDYILQETFKNVYSSVKGAKVVTDRTTGRTKGYGFVRFGDESEQIRAMSEMNGVLCSSRPMRIGPAATKTGAGGGMQKAPYQSAEGSQGESDPNNTTIFVGGLDPSVSDEALRQVFGQFGELIHVKIPMGKRCGFVQFATRQSAEQALAHLNGTELGGQNVRLSWGRSPSSKQGQPEQAQYGGGGGGGYYGYGQGYGYAPPAQDPNAYYGVYAGAGGYGGYQQQPQQ
ncbi:putative RNA recognition motif domain, nucleotide-binding alpha-beta plait domain superfamily [Helianthus annuus]|uniref:Putative RNA-binding protein 45A n=1 Tax=Helianthus annuus TaxID=4232 RepID=A0A251TDC7_HELAN|nr:polyadenylate-binding protein RBP45 isoform X1 [Helianthus annuus]KAF5781550.1 putative RNA recognition motif domain, nucleotide-binding alpha-beta plait domain superfamily [Helianthus annuus]KAJ0734178.1 putative RNA recognition motif domain, nucleotide-binding alpha-beta plait domain superfamily [Helianthus annuus]